MSLLARKNEKNSHLINKANKIIQSGGNHNLDTSLKAETVEEAITVILMDHWEETELLDIDVLNALRLAKKRSDADRNNYYHLIWTPSDAIYVSRYWDENSILCYRKGKLYSTHI